MSVEWDNLDQLGRAELTGYEAGKRDEQERLIKLLEAKYRYLIDTYGIALVQEQLDLLLELMSKIKGEK